MAHEREVLSALKDAHVAAVAAGECLAAERALALEAAAARLAVESDALSTEEQVVNRERAHNRG